MSFKAQYNFTPCSPNELIISYLRNAFEVNKDPEVGKEIEKAQALLIGLEDYVIQMASPETELQKKIFYATVNQPLFSDRENGTIKTQYGYHANIMSGPQQGTLLKIIAQMLQAERILEIGLFTGYGAATFCDSPYSREVTSLEIEPFFAKFVRDQVRGTPADEKLRILVGPALDSLNALKQEKKVFDLVFIDADKDNYINYYNFIMNNGLLGPHGVILVDNTIWKGKVYSPDKDKLSEVLHEFNCFVRSDSRVDQFIVPVRDGLSIILPKWHKVAGI